MKQLIIMARPYNKTASNVIVMNPEPPTVVTVITAYRDDLIYRITMEDGTAAVVNFAPGEVTKKITVDPRYLFLDAPSEKSARRRAKNLITKFKLYAGTQIAG